MKKLILASALTLIVSSAFASDKFLGDTSEYYGSPLLDHGPGTKTDQLGENHDHGDDVMLNHTQHSHDGPLKKSLGSSVSAADTDMHDHGDDVIKNHTPHSHR